MLYFVMQQLIALHNEIWQVTYKASDVVLDLAGLLFVCMRGEGNKKLDIECAATPRSIQLLLLVGTGKVVAATARDMLGITVATSSSSAGSGGTQQQQAESSSSSRQSVGSTSRGSGGVLGLGIGLGACAAGRTGDIETSSSSSETRSATNRSSSSAGGCMEAGEEGNTSSGAQSSSSSSSGGGHSKGKGSNSSGMVPGRIPADAMNRTIQQFMMDPSSGPLSAALASSSNLLISISPLAKTVMLGLLHFNCMAAWHKNVPEAAGTAAATAEGEEGSGSEGADAMHARAAGDQQQHVPKRLAKLPRQGLPTAVVEQMEKISSSWPSKVLVQMHLPGEEAKQKQLLQDLLRLGHVLMVEVPTPVGCNNPGCMALGGVSEVEAAAKTCGGCRVARYCSQDCQRGHWKVHKETCQTLQQQLKDQE